MQSVLAADVPLERPLVLADIGCRWGIPDRWQEHGDALEIYAFDADEKECERLARGKGADRSAAPHRRPGVQLSVRSRLPYRERLSGAERGLARGHEGG